MFRYFSGVVFCDEWKYRVKFVGEGKLRASDIRYMGMSVFFRRNRALLMVISSNHCLLVLPVSLETREERYFGVTPIFPA